ncbi:MAG: aldo/keto reductase [Acidimicrobiales bacterium]
MSENLQSNAVPVRRLGATGPELGVMGLGCWAIGGPVTHDDGHTIGWGSVDDSESVAAIQKGLDLGVTLFDTANVYGRGHSETLVGQALRGHDEVLVATKFGFTVGDEGDSEDKLRVAPAEIRAACEASLRRLGRDHIDLYQLHVGSLADAEADAAAGALEELQTQGLIRHFGWSSDVASQVARWAARGTCAAVQIACNVLEDKPEFFELCEKTSMTALIRSPLASGFLSGKYGPESRLPADDWRAQATVLGWGDMFRPDGSAEPRWLAKLDALREVLTDGGRSLVQGALGWLWARSPAAVPIPGFKTPSQVEENVGAIRYGPLPAGHLRRIDEILGR